MKTYLIKIFFLCLILTSAVFAQEEIEKLRAIINKKPSDEKAAELYKFKNDYPQSQYFGRANLELFNTFLAMGKSDSALKYADEYLQGFPETARGNAYNSIAFSLAEHNTGLDSALAYATRAVDIAASNPGYLKSYQDTKAYVLYKRGDYKSALELQQQAVIGNEDDSEYLYHLALYQAGTGNKKDGLKTAALAALLGYPGEALTAFLEWGKDVDDSAKVNIVSEVVNNFINNPEIENKTILKSNAAAFMSQVNVNTAQAKEWAEEGVNSINDKTMVEEYVTLKKNYAILLLSENNYDAALKNLEEVKDLVDPWTGDFWLTLGKVYENSGQKDKALDAYVSGLIAFENPVVLQPALTLASREEIDAKIDKMKEELSDLEPGKFEPSKNSSGKVILAELFTGAECGPCVAADQAFDKLSEYYPRSSMIILEYHVHIPGADPLTNPKTIDRYQWYGGNFGTPTVFFEGTEQIIGGGPGYVTANRFNVYKYAINKHMDKKPGINFTGNVKLNNNIVDIKLNVNSENIDTSKVKPMLHIALTEKSVNYTGANGVSKHIFVVRDIVEGTEVVPGNADVNKSIDLPAVSKTITDYLTDPSKTWKFRAAFNGWRLSVDELDNIDTKNLAVVAWIQDENTKEVLQAQYFDVN